MVLGLEDAALLELDDAGSPLRQRLRILGGLATVNESDRQLALNDHILRLQLERAAPDEDGSTDALKGIRTVAG